MTNGTIINRFLNHLRRDGKSVLTLSAYATDLKQFASEISPATLESLFSSLLITHCSLLIKKLSPNSRARKLTSIREFLRWCYQKGYVKRDLSKHIELPRRETQHKAKALSVSQIGRLRRHANPLERLLLELLLQTGMRLKDVLALRMHNIATSRFPLSNHLQQALAYYLDSNKQHTNNYLLKGPRGKKLSVRSAQLLLSSLCKKAGVRSANPRNLRATWILRNPISYRTIKKGSFVNE